MEEQALTFGAQKIEDSIVEIIPVCLTLSTKKTHAFLVRSALGQELYALTIIIATGSSPRKLGIPGEQDYWGKGVHTCPRCDALFYKGHDVAIVGGGDTAVEYAELLASYARHVTIIVRSPAMRAAARVKARLIDYDNITVLYHQRVAAVLGDAGKMVGLALEDVVTGEQSTLPVKGLFLAIGHEPSVNLVRSLVDLELTDHIRLRNRNQATSMEGIFSAGDVNDSDYRQAVVAAAQGAMAALDAVTDLHERGVTEHFIRHLRSMNLLFQGEKLAQ
jgi:thioredoxin reductase (NADPH)